MSLVILIGQAGIFTAHAAAPKVDVSWFGLDPTAYDHTSGAGGTTADGLRPELQAEDFSCDDKVVFYALIDGSSLVGTNTTTVNLLFGHETSSSQAFGFSSGVSFSVVGSDPNDTGNGNETLTGSFSGGGSTDLGLSMTVGNVEGDEDIYVRVVTVLGNCGPGAATGNVLTKVDSATTVNDATGANVTTSAGAQTVPLKFSGQRATGTIEVVKDLVPTTDPGTFTLRIDGTTYATGGDGADTGALNFLQGVYTVDETGAGGTNLGDYTTSISCQNGAGTPAVTNGTSASVTIAPGDAWVCTITNTRKAAPPPTLSIALDKTNDANQDAAFHNSEPANTAGQDVEFQLTIANNSVVAVVVESPIVDAFGGANHNVTSCKDAGNHEIVGSSIPANTSVTCTYTELGYSQNVGQPDKVNTATVNVHQDGDPTNTASASDDSTVVAPAPPTPPTLSITVDKTNDANQDAAFHDTEQASAAGQAVDFKAVIANTSTVAVVIDSITDSFPVGQHVNVCDGVTGANLIGTTIPAGQSVTCSFTLPTYAPAAGSSKTDTVDVGVHESGNASNTASSSDDSTVTTPAAPPPPPAGIVLVKDGPAVAHVGGTITYTFAVTLAASSPPLSGVSVNDPICDAGTLSGPTGDDGDAILEQGETWRFSCTHTVTATDPDPLPNTATACGTGPTGQVCDQGSHSVDIVHPAITIRKTAHPTSGAPGDTITYTYRVTNSGDVDLFDVSVDDDVLGHICDVGLLHPDSTVTCSAAYTIPQGANISIENVATATGTDATRERVTDRDNAIVDIVLGQTITPTKTPPAGLAFTGGAELIRLAGSAGLLLLVGSTLLWVGRREDAED